MAEAVGIVLAIAPLIISAFEDYKHIARSFEAFKGYSQKIYVNYKTLKIQAWIFRKKVEILLSYCFDDEDQAHRMLADQNDSSWQDPQIASLYLERLGDSRGVFEDSVELISYELSHIRKTLAEFKTPVGTGSKTIKKRIKYVFKEPDIEKALAVLKEKNQDLITVVDLIIPLELRQETPVHSFATQKELDRFARVQETAENLYQALGHACTKHTYHQAHLSLEPVCYDASQIRFAIAFSQLSLACSSNKSTASTWLKVESCITGRIKSRTGESSLVQTQRSLKRAFSDDASLEDSKDRTGIVQCSVEETEVKGKVRKFTRFQELSGLAKGTTPSTAQTPPLVNLCTNNDFCDQLRKFINQSQPSMAAVGFLELPGESKHLVYIDSKSQIVTQGSEGSSLPNLTTLQDTYAQSNTSFTTAQKTSLAKQLAKAVLQFHATPG